MGDEEALVDLEVRFCKVGDWKDQKKVNLTGQGELKSEIKNSKIKTKTGEFDLVKVRDEWEKMWKTSYECPEDTFATTIRVRSEGSQWSPGDDTAMNGFKMGCRSLNWGPLQYAVNSKGEEQFDGLWGAWRDDSEEKEDFFISEIRAKYEGSRKFDNSGIN